MTIAQDLPNLKNLVARWEKGTVQSTGASVVDYLGALYNVEGSTGDPHIGGLTWRQLLIRYGINHNCYVDPSAAPGDSSHPGFNVGGHMTPNATGQVPTGGTCYLMPLCSWHNSTARDGQAFAHVQTRMLKLTGYDQSDFAASFVARLPSRDPFSIIYAGAEGWQTMNLSAADGAKVKAGDWQATALGAKPDRFVLLERQRAGMLSDHAVRAVQL